MCIKMRPIGVVRTDAVKIPRHWSISNVEGHIVIDEKYIEGLKDIRSGQFIIIIFHFHKSQEFTSEFLTQKPPNRKKQMGVFSICSPIRPNPIGMSVLEVLNVKRGIIQVKGLDILDGTPVLDIKPYIKSKYSCPSFKK
ncbi:MAG TPA: tRNA (N6-threonylcarbamoyladenosine(37)-N6)-methyltransferase TrmO [Desulfobacteraceae bacterium]|nr:tRNA (N6-threonylcarbamoyladenosine(37)-N6)-methyltransferase TrmO [Desulfobacteraceae bacterium]